jgi:hypothetical protein
MAGAAGPDLERFAPTSVAHTAGSESDGSIEGDESANGRLTMKDVDQGQVLKAWKGTFIGKIKANPSASWKVQYLRRIRRKVETGEIQDPRSKARAGSSLHPAAPLQKASLSSAAMQGFLTSHQFGVNDDIARQRFGERLYPLVQLQEPLLAEKITGMLLELPLATLKELCSDAVALSDHVTRCVDVLEEQWNQLEKTAFWDDEDYGIDQDWEANEHSTPRLEHADGGLDEQATRDLVAWLHAGQEPAGQEHSANLSIATANSREWDTASIDGSVLSYDTYGDDSSVSGRTWDGTCDGSSQYSHSQCGSRAGDDFDADQDTTGAESRAQEAMRELVGRRGPVFVPPPSANVPPSFLCPITHAVMRDPVMCADGHTYERSAIQQWLSAHKTSPLTNAELPTTVMIPNIALRNAIQELVLRNVMEQVPEDGAVASAEPGRSAALSPDAPIEARVYARVEELIMKVAAVDQDSIANVELFKMLPCVLSGDKAVHRTMIQAAEALKLGSRDELVSVLCAAIFAFEMYSIG